MGREFREQPLGLRFGSHLGDALIGRVDVVAVDPPSFGFGYWLDEGRGGRGLATAACAQALLVAMAELGATDVYAGVTHGNTRSVALLLRLGFHATRDFPDHSRFALHLD